MQRPHSQLIFIAGLVALQAHLPMAGPQAADAPTIPVVSSSAPPPRESEVFPFLKGGGRAEGTDSRGPDAAPNAQHPGPAPAANAPRPDPTGYLRRLGVSGASNLRFESAPSLVEESIPLPMPPMLQRPLISASYSRGPMEWEGNQPTPLRPVTESPQEQVPTDEAPAGTASTPLRTSTIATPASPPIRIVAGGPTAAPGNAEPAHPSQPVSQFQSITPFFQVSPLSPGSTPPGLILQFVGPDTRPAPSASSTLKSRAVYESK